MEDFFVTEWDASRLNTQLDALTVAVGGASGQMGDMGRIIENESRSFLRRQIALTPPKTKAQGEAAIERDFNKIFTPVNEEFLSMIGSQFGVAGIDTWITGQDGKKDHLQWDRIDPSGSGMDAFHKANLNKRGRTRNLKRKGMSWYSPYVVSWESFKSYLSEIQSHVGRRKAGWAESFVSVGGKVPEWIARHLSMGFGMVLNSLKTPQTPSITMINRAPGIMDDERIFNDNIRISQRTIMQKCRMILQGYAYDMATGKVISPKEMQEAA